MSEARATLELSQAAVASRAGLPVTTYRKYERDQRRPKGDALLRIAKALRVRGEWLATGEEPRSATDSRVEHVVNQVLADYEVESLLDVVIEAVESTPGAVKLTPREKAAVVSGALKVFRSLPDAEREKGAVPIVMAIMDRLLERPPARNIPADADQEWPLVERRQRIRRKGDSG